MTNPFADTVSVQIVTRRPTPGFFQEPLANWEFGEQRRFDGMSLETAGDGEMVELTIRVPEQFFTRKYRRDVWDLAVKYNHVGDLLDAWLSDTDPETEVYGPDGQQVSLW